MALPATNNSKQDENRKPKQMILLSFDIEEFDVPREHGVDIPIEEQMSISVQGARSILAVLKEHGVKATFFCTANFARRATDVVRQIVADGHELASHGFYHWTFEPKDLLSSKLLLEELTGTSVKGYRQARIQPVSDDEISKAGYTFNSSLNPTFIPGRYMHLNAPRTVFRRGGLWQVPATVTPLVRFPLFWLSAHNLPMWLYLWMCGITHRHDGYMTTYFHPWEFTELNARPDLNLPFIIRNHSGEKMIGRLSRFISYFQKRGADFVTYSQFLSQRNAHAR